MSRQVLHRRMRMHFLLLQVPLAPRARSSSETSTRLDKEAEKESSDEADGKSPPDTARKGKPADGKENSKVEDWICLRPFLWVLSALRSTARILGAGRCWVLGATTGPPGSRKPAAVCVLPLAELRVRLVQLVSLEAHQECIPLRRGGGLGQP